MLGRENEIRKLAKEFRAAFAELKAEDVPLSEHLLNFPRGCCGDASDLLVEYFRQKGIEVESVSGVRRSGTHAWLEVDGLIVDITADQFPGVQEEVLVTHDKSWHNQFKNQKRSDSNFREFGRYNSDRLSGVYDILMDIIQKKSK